MTAAKRQINDVASEQPADLQPIVDGLDVHKKQKVDSQKKVNANKMDPKTLDWDALPFGFVENEGHVRMTFKNGGWQHAEVVNEPYMTVHIGATGLHYGQVCFEGLKAFRMKDGKIRCFRPEQNYKRMVRSCNRVLMPTPTYEQYLSAIERCILLNMEYVPPYESRASLYLRLLVFGSGGKLGLSEADEYTFLVIVSPVGDYYAKGQSKPVKSIVSSEFDRAAPLGVGAYKLGGNYAPTLLPGKQMKEKGYPVVLFLDAKSREYIDEFSTSK